MRASYQRAYFAPALFNLIPVETDLIASMAVDVRWRLYYNDALGRRAHRRRERGGPDSRSQSPAAPARGAQDSGGG